MGLCYTSPMRDPGRAILLISVMAAFAASTGVAELDFGDAPDSEAAPRYPTLSTNNGAHHTVMAGIFLGESVDAEPDGQPSENADGDGTDEDGITFVDFLRPDSVPEIHVVASSAGLLQAWIDMDHNDTWGPEDQILANQPLLAGTNSLVLAMPAYATAGPTFARFRFSSQPNVPVTGPAPDGEVEDYAVTIEEWDFGDAPDESAFFYQTSLANTGAYHVVDPGIFLGTFIDSEIDAVPDELAMGDDDIGSFDDEDGIQIHDPMLRGGMKNVTVNASATGYLQGWIDFNADGDWLDAGEQVFSNATVVAGDNVLAVAIPDDAVTGRTYARFRLSSQPDIPFFGRAQDGEVEDYVVNLADADFGDAPDDPGTPEYPTLRINDGAAHTLLPGIHLGEEVDADGDGQPTEAADGDDRDADGNDEDGVVFGTPLVRGWQVPVSITASAEGYLSAWIDFDGNGDWQDVGDLVLDAEALASGTNDLYITIPAGAMLGRTYARFRFSTESSLPPTGWAPDGEVEDYVVTIVGLDFGDAGTPYPTMNNEGGAHHAVFPAIGMGASIDVDPDGQPTTDADGDDRLDEGDDEDGVEFLTHFAPGSNASVRVNVSTNGFLQAWLDLDGDASWDETEHVISNAAVTAGDTVLTFPVPFPSSEGQPCMRFRFSTQPVYSPLGFAPDGEVEDYKVEIDAPQFDFGDAPDSGFPPSYPTMSMSDGARHLVVAGVYLGASIDPEPDGQSDEQALGDDLDLGGDDEDGVVFEEPVTIGRESPVRVTASTGGYLQAWIDFDDDGSWNSAEEHVVADLWIGAGETNVGIVFPSFIDADRVFARFRFSTQPGLDPSGAAPDGEVEDYLVETAGRDFGDAPDSPATPGYPTLSAHNGARHILVPGVVLGLTVDAESDGQPSLASQGDDMDLQGDDEDGVNVEAPWMPGETVELPVTVSTSGYLQAWVDFNADFDWSDAGEHVFSNRLLSAGRNDPSFHIPLTVQPMQTYARFRFCTQPNVGFAGEAPDGEVEDYLVEIAAWDFGDAPDGPGYPTLFAHDGARHLVTSGPLLGSLVDSDVDGQPSDNADGDDLDGDGDDEDGVIFPERLYPDRGASFTVSIPVAGYLQAWIDFNRDGDWNDENEKIMSDYLVIPAVHTFGFFVPASATPGVTYARFRISSVTGIGPSGPAPDGEVEDHAVEITATDFGDAPVQYETMRPVGASHIVGGPWLGDTSDAPDAEPDGQPAPDAMGDDEDGNDDENGVTVPRLWAGESTNITVRVSGGGGVLSGWIDFDGDGSWQEAAEIVCYTNLTDGLHAIPVHVPSNAAAGTTFARFRICSGGAPEFSGEVADGEVEDHAVFIAKWDFGDAPALGYPTLMEEDGARHVVVPELHLGLAVDTETQGRPSPGSDGDDRSGIDDEDGVFFPEGLLVGFTCRVDVVSSSDSLLLSAWLDFDTNGNWETPTERIFADTPLAVGSNTLYFALPGDSADGFTFARFRCSTDAGLFPTGAADDGEVEDYEVRIRRSQLPGPFDTGDAPESYHTSPPLGPRHNRGSVNIGSRWDSEFTAWVSADATGDDLDNTDDEDGIMFEGSDPSPYAQEDPAYEHFVAGAWGYYSAEFSATTSAVGQLFFFHSWFDWNANGAFDESEYDAIGVTMEQTNFSRGMLVYIPEDAVTGDLFARFRLAEVSSLAPTGVTANGEVEDYLLTDGVTALDFGDAPDPSYPTRIGSGGATHRIVPGIHLGNTVDSEPEGWNSDFAEGDDTFDGSDDEDGVFPIGAIIAGQSASFYVVASSQGRLNAWADFSGDGNWGDPDEQIALDLLLQPGTNLLTFPVPTYAANAVTMRFRFSTAPGIGISGPAPDGEVEDYRFPVGVSVNWLQEPDSEWGLDIPTRRTESPTEAIVQAADDWLGDGRPVIALRWWGSYIDWQSSWPGPVDPPEAARRPRGFRLTLMTDVPDPDGDGPAYGMPGGSITNVLLLLPPYGDGVTEKYYGSALLDYLNPTRYEHEYEYFASLPGPWIVTEGSVYWLMVEAVYPAASEPPQYPWGWLTANRRWAWNDAAVIREWTAPPQEPPWRRLVYPPAAPIWSNVWSGVTHPYHGEPVDMAFHLYSSMYPSRCESWLQPSNLENGMDLRSWRWQETQIWPTRIRLRADDFLSDGRPITDITWWGSYITHRYTEAGSESAPIPPPTTPSQHPVAFQIGLYTHDEQTCEPAAAITNVTVPSALCSETYVGTIDQSSWYHLPAYYEHEYRYRADLLNSVVSGAAWPLEAGQTYWISIQAVFPQNFDPVGDLPEGWGWAISPLPASTLCQPVVSNNASGAWSSELLPVPHPYHGDRFDLAFRLGTHTIPQEGSLYDNDVFFDTWSMDRATGLLRAASTGACECGRQVLQTSTDLTGMEGGWTTVATNPLPHPDSNTWFVDPSTPQRFFRILTTQ